MARARTLRTVVVVVVEKSAVGRHCANAVVVVVVSRL
jgi:hypothetical protein